MKWLSALLLRLIYQWQRSATATESIPPTTQTLEPGALNERGTDAGIPQAPPQPSQALPEPNTTSPARIFPPSPPTTGFASTGLLTSAALTPPRRRYPPAKQPARQNRRGRCAYTPTEMLIAHQPTISIFVNDGGLQHRGAYGIKDRHRADRNVNDVVHIRARNFGQVLDDATRRLNLPRPAKRMFDPSGVEIFTTNQLGHGDDVVISMGENFRQPLVQATMSRMTMDRVSRLPDQSSIGTSPKRRGQSTLESRARFPSPKRDRTSIKRTHK